MHWWWFVQHLKFRQPSLDAKMKGLGKLPLLFDMCNIPYLFTYKAHSVIRRTLNFRRRLWQVSKIKISPKYPVIRRTQNYRKIFSNYAEHSSSFLWSKLQVEDRCLSFVYSFTDIYLHSHFSLALFIWEIWKSYILLRENTRL